MDEEKTEEGAKKKQRKIRNKHWKFLRKTFQAAQLAKSILPGSSHAPLEDVEADKNQSAKDSLPSPLHRSLSSPLRQGKRPGSGILKGVNKSVPSVPLHAAVSGDESSSSSSSESDASFADDENGFSEDSRDGKVQHEISLEIAKQRILARAHKRRRLTFLQQTAVEEDFICKTLGMDQVYGRCIRHSNQPITPNPQALLWGTEFCTIQTCRICQSEMRAGPTALQTSCVSLPTMGSVIEQVQQMQSNTKEWDKRTKILGASVMEMNHSHDSYDFFHTSQNSNSYGHDVNIIIEASSSHHSVSNQPSASMRTDTIPEESELEDFVEDGSLSLNDLHGSLHAYTNHSGTNHTATTTSNRSTESSIQYTEEEWAAQLSRRIVQVRTWQDRFAIKNHPTFCQYFKMLRLGVPMDAVKSTVEQDGYHPAITDLDPNKSIKMQAHLLSPEVMENLHMTGALGEDAGGPGGKDGDKELSVPETVQKVLEAVRQRRMNQVYATMALFSEMKVKSQYEKQKRYDMLIDEHSKSYKSMNSMPVILAKVSGDETQLTRMLTSREAEHLEMDDEIISQSERMADPSLRTGIGFLSSLQAEAKVKSESNQKGIVEGKSPVIEQPLQDESGRSSPLVVVSTNDEENAKIPIRYASIHNRENTKEAVTYPKASPNDVTSSQNDKADKLTIRSPKSASSQSHRTMQSSQKKLHISPYRQMRKQKVQQSSSPTSPSKSRSSRTLRDAMKDDVFGRQSAIITELIEVVEQPKLYDSTENFGQSAKAANEDVLVEEPPVSDRWSASPKTPLKKRVSKTKLDMPPVSEVLITDQDDTTDHERIKQELQSLIEKQKKEASRNEIDVDTATASSNVDEILSIPLAARSATSSPSKNRLNQKATSSGEDNPLLKYLDESYRDGKRSENDSAYSPDVKSSKISTIRLSPAVDSTRSKLKKSVSLDEFTRLKKELDAANSIIASKDDEIKNCVKMEKFELLQEELQSAYETIALNNDEISNRVKIAEFEKLRGELTSAWASIERSEKIINNSVRRDVYQKACQDLKNAKETIASFEMTIQGLIDKKEHEKVLNELNSAKANLSLMEGRVERSVTIDEYEKISKELDKRYEEIAVLKKELHVTKKELKYSSGLMAEKTKALEEMGRNLVKKDEAIQHLKHCVHQMERKEKRQNGQVLGSTSMQTKIEDEKRRQAKLREKYASPHRVKRTVTQPTTDRDFEALALSPAGNHQRLPGRQRRVPKSTSEHTNRAIDTPPVGSASRDSMLRNGKSSPALTPNLEKRKSVSSSSVSLSRSRREQEIFDNQARSGSNLPTLSPEKKPISPSHHSAFASVGRDKISPDQLPPLPVKKPSPMPVLPAASSISYSGKSSRPVATTKDNDPSSPSHSTKPTSIPSPATAASSSKTSAHHPLVSPTETMKGPTLQQLLQSPQDEAAKKVIMSLFDSWTTKQFES
jgi:hypothetical protein